MTGTTTKFCIHCKYYNDGFCIHTELNQKLTEYYKHDTQYLVTGHPDNHNQCKDLRTDKSIAPACGPGAFYYEPKD
jgi:hypothetical protein